MPKNSENTMQGTMEPVATALTMLLGKKPVSVSASVVVTASASELAFSTSELSERPAPGLKMSAEPMPNADANSEDMRNAAAALRPTLESCFLVSDPTASMIWHITKGTMPIWMSRKKMSPRNLIWLMDVPPTKPAAIPATMAITTPTVELYLNFRALDLDSVM